MRPAVRCDIMSSRPQSAPHVPIRELGAAMRDIDRFRRGGHDTETRTQTPIFEQTRNLSGGFQKTVIEAEADRLLRHTSAS